MSANSFSVNASSYQVIAEKHLTNIMWSFGVNLQITA